MAFGPLSEEEKRIRDEDLRQQIHVLIEETRKVYGAFVVQVGGVPITDAQSMRGPNSYWPSEVISSSVSEKFCVVSPP